MKIKVKFFGKIGYLMLTALFIISSCVKDDLSQNEIPKDKEALVNISFGMHDPDAIEARASAEVEQAITTLHILIFNSEGKIQTIKYIPDYVGATAAEKQIATRSGSNCTIYAVANMHGGNTGSHGDESFFDNVTTLAQFEDMYVTILQGDVERNNGMISVGKMIVDINPLPTVTSPETLYLYRLSSKITLNVKDGTPSGHTVNIIDYEIYNLPLYSYFATKPEDYYTNNTSLGANAFYSGTEYNFVDASVDYNDGKGAQAVKQGQFYMVENRRGGRKTVDGDTGTSTNQRQKVKYAPDYATYVVIKAMYYDKIVGKSMMVRYKVFLGKNNSDDYNIERHKLYTYNVTITGITETDVTVDSRVNVTETFLMDIRYADRLDAHFEYRPLKISTFTGYTRIEILNTDGTDLTAPTSSWLKFSKLDTYPNNDDVIVDADNALKTIETIDHTGSDPTVLDTYWRYLYANENITGSDRSILLRVTATDENDISALKDPTKSITIDKIITQKTISILGRFGGTTDSTSADEYLYSQNLGVEHFEENALVFRNEDQNLAQTAMPWGFKNIVTGVNAKDYGLPNTKTLVARSDYGITGIYNPVYNTFAARYCYEKNRDINGNGRLDDSEIVWYLPAQNQLMAVWISYAAVPYPFNADNYWSATENGCYNGWGVNFGNGYKADYGRVRCVRDL